MAQKKKVISGKDIDNGVRQKLSEKFADEIILNANRADLKPENAEVGGFGASLGQHDRVTIANAGKYSVDMKLPGYKGQKIK